MRKPRLSGDGRDLIPRGSSPAVAGDPSRDENPAGLLVSTGNLHPHPVEMPHPAGGDRPDKAPRRPMSPKTEASIDALMATPGFIATMKEVASRPHAEDAATDAPEDGPPS